MSMSKTRASGDTAAAVALADLLKGVSGDVAGVIKQLLTAAMTSPLIGAFLVFLLGDMAEKNGLMTPQSNSVMKGLVVAAIGVELGSDVLTALGNFIPSIGKAANSDFLKPSVNVLVLGDNAPKGMEGLLGRLTEAVKTE